MAGSADTATSSPRTSPATPGFTRSARRSEDGLEGEPPWSTVFYNTRKCIEYVRRESGLSWGGKRKD
jgi:hypothetical protein